MSPRRFSDWPVLLLLACAIVPAQADFTFSYNSHAYTLVATATNWGGAQADAAARGGTLARIDDAAENAAVLAQLTGRGITNAASDGGNSIYVWIGGRETIEGTYVWTNRNGTATEFWAGGKTGSGQNGLYVNWGRDTVGGGGPEPDNFNGTQNRAGFALEAWPKTNPSKIGQAGQWNDINGSDLLTYLVERTPPNAPANLAATVTSLSAINLTWVDDSNDEAGFYLWYRQGTAGDFTFLTAVAANTTNVPLSPLALGITYQFAVASFNDVGFLEPPVATVTMPGVTSRSFHPAVVGQAFSYTVAASSDGGAPDSYSLSGTLPAGLSFDAGAHQISGVPTEAGVFKLTMAAHYPVWGTLIKPFTLRVIHPPGPPVCPAPIPRQSLAAGGAAVTVPLNHFFADPDTEKAVRFVTRNGNFDVALYATATPQTVTNFLNYVNRGDYSDSIVHRAVPNFVVQGGGFKPAPPNFTRIPTDPSPTNEPGIQHIRGTIAMAKLGSDPNSATDQWFVNLKDNSAELDDQNGGFTAFGRVCGNGLTVVDAIAALPRGTYTVSVDGQTSPFSDWPMDTPPPAPATMDQSKLVLATAVTGIEPLTFAIAGMTVPGLISGAITGSSLTLTPAGILGGTTVVSVAATDLDGNTLSQPVTVEVASAYSIWLNQYALQGADATPGADKDGDSAPNAVEFALLGSPAAADAASFMPIGSIATVAAHRYGALAFKLRKNLSGLTVIMQASPTMEAETWATVWISADLSSPQVTQLGDQGNHWQITVRDATALSAGASQRFLRLLVNAPM